MALDTVNSPFKLRDRVVRPDLDRIQSPHGNIDVEPKAMAVLVCLAKHYGQVVSADHLIDEVWHGRPMGDNPVYKCIAKLRKALGDSSQKPQFIATVPTKGYRLLCQPQALAPSTEPGIRPAVRETVPASTDHVAPARPRHWWWALPVVVLLITVGFVLPRLDEAPPPEQETPSQSQIAAGSIAVLVFDEIQGSPEHPQLAEGVSEEIRARLSRVDGLAVTSSAASQAIAGRKLTPQQMRDELRVDHVLEGSVRVVGERIRYSARLINTQSGYDEWSGDGTRDYRDILELQDEIALAVVDALRIKLTRELSVPMRYTNSVDAYEEYRRGKSFLARSFEPEFLDAAQGHFDKALTHDPQYARAYAGLCEVLRRRFRRSHNALHFDNAEAACLRAQQIDPELAEVPLALGQLYRNSGRLDAAQENFERAIALNPNELDGYSGLAYTYVALNRTDEADALFRRAIDLFPTLTPAYARYAVMLYRAGRYKEALPMFEAARRLGATNASIISSLGACYFMLGDFEMAIRYFEQSIENRATANAHSSLGTAYYFIGRFDDAVAQYRAAVQLSPADFRLWSNLASGLRQIEDADQEATNACKEAVELGNEELSINPDDAHVMSRLANCQAYLGQRDAARSAVARAEELAPSQTDVLFNNAVALVEMGELNAAARMIEKAMAQGYPDAHVRVNPELRPALAYLQGGTQ